MARSIGQATDAPGNKLGIFLSDNANNIDITGNIMLGNTNPLADATPRSVAKIIANNIGYNPIARSNVSCSTSPCTIVNVTGAPLQILISGGTVTGVKEDSITLPPSTSSVILPQGSNLSVAYSAAPAISQKGL